MNQASIIVLISGNGTNLQAIIDEINQGSLNAKISLVISNRMKAYGLVRAQEAGIPVVYLPFLSKKMCRLDYEKRLFHEIISQDKPDLVVCAGWMYILGSEFLDELKHEMIPIINLHPALPGMFPGKDAIAQAFHAYQEGKVNRTGCMVHYVIPKIDAGAVIETTEVVISDNETEESLRKKVQSVEKPTLLRAIKQILGEDKMTNDEILKE